MSVISTLRRAAVPLTLLGLLAVAGGCAKIRPLTAPAAQRGHADYGIYVAMGSNLTAGFQSGGLAQRHQVLSYPNLFAGQAGSPRFSQPLVNLGGWPPLLKVKSFGPPLVLDSAGARGAFINSLTSPPSVLDSAYHNMAIPGALLADVNDPARNYDINLGRDVSFFYNIGRQQGRPIPLSLLQLVRNKRPTFVSFEYGVNEILGAATRGGSVSAGLWTDTLRVTLDSLDFIAPQAKKVIFNVPDVLKLPFFNTVPPVELTRNGTPVIGGAGVQFLIGPGGVPLQPGDLLTLQAISLLKTGVGYQVGDSSYYSGVGVNGTGTPLPGAVVLDATERAAIQTTVADFNTAIRFEATARGYALLDLHGMVNNFAASGVRFAGVSYSTKYLTGGLYGVDGIHPTDFFHGLICNTMIDLFRSKFASNIPPLDLSRTLTSTASSLANTRTEVPAAFRATAIPLERLGIPGGAP